MTRPEISQFLILSYDRSLTPVTESGLGKWRQSSMLTPHRGTEHRMNLTPQEVNRTLGSQSEVAGANSEGMKDNFWFCFSSILAGHLFSNPLNPR